VTSASDRLGRSLKSIYPASGEPSFSAEALSDRAVAVLVKGRARMAGIDPCSVSGHSLRSGYVTSAVEHGAAPMVIAEQTRHKSLDMLLVYSRRVERYRNHSGKAFL
jgi:site-specific recombinase XerD